MEGVVRKIYLFDMGLLVLAGSMAAVLATEHAESTAGAQPAKISKSDIDGDIFERPDMLELTNDGDQPHTFDYRLYGPAGLATEAASGRGPPGSDLYLTFGEWRKGSQIVSTSQEPGSLPPRWSLENAAWVGVSNNYFAGILFPIESDGELDPGDIGLPLARAIREAGPWGQQFPEPVFDGVFGLEGCRVVGEKHLKLSLRAEGASAAVDAIAFNASAESWPDGVVAVRCAYRLDVNEYRGRESAQLVIEHVEPA